MAPETRYNIIMLDQAIEQVALPSSLESSTKETELIPVRGRVSGSTRLSTRPLLATTSLAKPEITYGPLDDKRLRNRLASATGVCGHQGLSTIAAKTIIHGPRNSATIIFPNTEFSPKALQELTTDQVQQATKWYHSFLGANISFSEITYDSLEPAQQITVKNTIEINTDVQAAAMALLASTHPWFTDASFLPLPAVRHFPPTADASRLIQLADPKNQTSLALQREALQPNNVILNLQRLLEQSGIHVYPLNLARALNINPGDLDQYIHQTILGKTDPLANFTELIDQLRVREKVPGSKLTIGLNGDKPAIELLRQFLSSKKEKDLIRILLPAIHGQEISLHDLETLLTLRLFIRTKRSTDYYLTGTANIPDRKTLADTINAYPFRKRLKTEESDKLLASLQADKAKKISGPLQIIADLFVIHLPPEQLQKQKVQAIFTKLKTLVRDIYQKNSSPSLFANPHFISLLEQLAPFGLELELVDLKTSLEAIPEKGVKPDHIRQEQVYLRNIIQCLYAYLQAKNPNQSISLKQLLNHPLTLALKRCSILYIGHQNLESQRFLPQIDIRTAINEPIKNKKSRNRIFQESQRLLRAMRVRFHHPEDSPLFNND